MPTPVGQLIIPQLSLTFTADGVKYVVEFDDAHLTDGAFIWDHNTDLRLLDPPIGVNWPDEVFNFFLFNNEMCPFTQHLTAGIVARAGRTHMIDGIEHEVVHLFMANQGENLLDVLENPSRRL